MGFFIPETMKKLNNWVVWRKEGEGHCKKVPYDPRTGRRANPTKSCCCYEDALAYFTYSDDYDGIGFTFTNNCNMTFIDLDNCIEPNGNYSILASEVQQLFQDSYIELSQSERGLHTVCIGSVPKTIKTKEIEIYSSGRYMAMTGNALCFHEPQPAQKELDLLYNRFKTSEIECEPDLAPSFTSQEYSTDINALINIICHSKHGEKWSRLHDGDITGYPSRSEAVLAYISITNYYAGGRASLIRAIFALSRFPHDDDKYKKDYYITRAIQKAQEPFSYSNAPTPHRKGATDCVEYRRKRF